MKKTIWALALGLMMSASVFANGNRQVSTRLPADVPSVTVTMDGKTKQIKATEASVSEVDAKHIRCVVKAGADKATVVLPISFDAALEIALNAAEVARGLGIITEDQWEDIYVNYKKLKQTSVDK